MVIIKRRILISLFTICLLCIFCITAYAADPVTPKNTFDYKGTDVLASVASPYRTEKAYFKDEAEVLTPEQRDSIWEKLQSASGSSKIRIAVFLGGNYRSDSETEDFTYDCSAAIFGANSDCLFIYLDFEGKSPAYDYVRSFNKAERIFDANARDKILQAMYDYLPESGKPIYSDDVNKALISGINTVSNQYGLSTDRPSGSVSSRSDKYDEIDFSFLMKLLPLISTVPLFVYFIIGGIIVLILIFAILHSVKNSSYNGSSYYDGDSYYDRGRSYRSRSYRSSPRHRSSSSSRSHHSSSHSSRSSGSGSSGSGRHR